MVPSYVRKIITYETQPCLRNAFDLDVRMCRSVRAYYTVLYRVARSYNMLPSEINNCDSLNCYKSC